MLFAALLLVLLPYLPLVLGAAEGQQLPFEFFLGPEQEELSSDVPLAFHPDDGFNYRRSYEGKYGKRGERLIALLGGGVAPLSIFDASLFGGKNLQTRSTAEPTTTVATEPHASGSQEVVVKAEAPESNTSTATTDSPNIDDNVSSPAPQESYFGNRKYVEINRRKYPDDFMQNIIPQKESYSMSPDGIIYKRLYGAVWNFGEKGLQRRFPPSFMPSTWPFLPSPFDIPSLGLPGVTSGDTSKSESAYAGPGEPSIVVQSYSYDR